MIRTIDTIVPYQMGIIVTKRNDASTEPDARHIDIYYIQFN